ncbi:MAG: hypothetical protein J6U64_00275, partial [Alphaproteobacteria bacterium]|nr:hypothetical protein [Alphaproteobacteria bacterium]
TGQCTVGGCASEQECCGGKCISKCSATNCERCDSSSSSCVKDEINCGDCRDEWNGSGEKWDDVAHMMVPCTAYQTLTFKCLGTCYTAGTSTESIADNGCLASATKIDRDCCPIGKVVCGPSSAQECCELCNADNTGCCVTGKICGEGENKTCCEDGCDSFGNCCEKRCEKDGETWCCEEDDECGNLGQCCQTFDDKTNLCCENGEKPTTYYPDYNQDNYLSGTEIIWGRAVKGCCVSTGINVKKSWMGIEGQVCCPASKPYYGIVQELNDYYYYGCSEYPLEKKN